MADDTEREVQHVVRAVNTAAAGQKVVGLGASLWSWVRSHHGPITDDMRSNAGRWLLDVHDRAKVHAVAFFTFIGGILWSVIAELANLTTSMLLPAMKAQLHSPDLWSIALFAVLGGAARAIQLAYYRGQQQKGLPPGAAPSNFQFQPNPPPGAAPSSFQFQPGPPPAEAPQPYRKW